MEQQSQARFPSNAGPPVPDGALARLDEPVTYETRSKTRVQCSY